MADLILRQIERSSVTFTTTDLTKTLNLTTTLLSTSKTILLFTVRSTSASPQTYHVLGRILSTTQIQFERSSLANGDAVVEYQVIEFVQGITVQHLYFNQTAGTTDTAISTVTTSKAFPILTMYITGTGFGANDLISAEITTNVNLQTIMGGFTEIPVAVQIVEIDNATVQKVTGTYGTGATADVGVTSITESSTFWFFTLNTSSSLTFDSLPYLAYVNSSTLRFTRAITTGGVNFNYVVYAVGLSSGVTVQNISTTITSGNTTVSPSISNIVVNSTALLLNGAHQRFAMINAADDDAGGNSLTLSGLTTSAFTATRADAPALDTTTNVQVLSFRSEVDQVISICDFF